MFRFFLLVHINPVNPPAGTHECIVIVCFDIYLRLVSSSLFEILYFIVEKCNLLHF